MRIYFCFRQLMAGALGMAIMFVIMKVDYHLYQKPAVVFSALAVVVGLVRFVFFLPATRNTHRWIQLPGLSFQPSEMAKLALIVFLAYFLEKRKGRINEMVHARPHRRDRGDARGPDRSSEGSRHGVGVADDGNRVAVRCRSEHEVDRRVDAGRRCRSDTSRFTSWCSSCRTGGSAFWRFGIRKRIRWVTDFRSSSR